MSDGKVCSFGRRTVLAKTSKVGEVRAAVCERRPARVAASARTTLTARVMLNRTQQSPFGLGQATLPGGRSAGQRPASGAGAPPTSPGATMRGNFPMGAAAAALSPQAGTLNSAVHLAQPALVLPRWARGTLPPWRADAGPAPASSLVTRTR